MEQFRRHRLGGLNYQLQYYQNLAQETRNMKLADIQAKNMKDLQDSLKVQTDALKTSPLQTVGTIGTTIGTAVLGKVIPKVGKSLYAKYKASKKLSKTENGEEDEDEGDFPDDIDEAPVGDSLPADSDAFGSLNVADPDSMVGTSTDLPTRLQVASENFDESWRNSGRSFTHPEYDDYQDSYLEDVEDAYNQESEDLGRAPEEPAPRPPTRVQSLQRGRGPPAEEPAEEDPDEGFVTAEEDPEGLEGPEVSEPTGATANNPDYFNEADESGYTQFEKDNGLDFDVDDFREDAGEFDDFEPETQNFPSAADELDRIQSQLESGEIEETTIPDDPEEGLGFFAKHLGRMVFGKPEPFKPPSSRFGGDDPLTGEERSFFNDYMEDRYGDSEPTEADVVGQEGPPLDPEQEYEVGEVQPSAPEDLAEFNRPLPGPRSAGIEDTGELGGEKPISPEEAAQTELPGEQTPQFETAGQRLTPDQMARTTLPDEPDGTPQWLKASELEPEARPSASDSTLARLFHSQKAPQEQFDEHQSNLEQQTQEVEAPTEEAAADQPAAAEEPTQPSSLAEEGESAAPPTEPETGGGYDFEGFGEPAEEAGEVGEEAGEIGTDVAEGAEAAGDVAEGVEGAAAAVTGTAEALDVAAAATAPIPGLDIVMGVIGGIATAVGAGLSIASAVSKANASKEKAPDATAPTPNDVASKPQNFNYVGASSENYFDANQHFSGF